MLYNPTRILATLFGLVLGAGTAQAEDARISTLLAAAHAQVGVTVRYDAAYARLDYPSGDVPADRGVCTDVVIRAFRALGVDLQQRVHQDMRRHFAAYPALWGLKAPDRNIDHRRVPNLAAYFTRQGTKLPATSDPDDYLPGDIVTWSVPPGLPHIGLISDRRSDGRPLVVHNIGAGTRVEDALFAFPITGHWRWMPDEAALSTDEAPP
jgi:uncharacterized protein YijF (DUF1287 family)